MKHLVVAAILCLCLFSVAFGDHGRQAESMPERRHATRAERDAAVERYNQSPTKENYFRAGHIDRSYRSAPPTMPDVDRSQITGNSEVERYSKWSY
jgi:hypothetical protein